VVGGATSVLSGAALTRARVFALAGLLIALVAYGAVAADLGELPNRVDVVLVALLVLPASLAAIWLALPLAQVSPSWLLLAGVALAALSWGGFELIGADSAANVSKLACFALIGLWFVSLFEELWWVALVAVLVPWADVWSVAFGPTRYVLDEKPGLFEQLSVAFALPGGGGTFNLGPPDVIFFALFLAAALRFRLRVGWTWISMTGFLALTLIVVWEWETAGLPALPAVCLGFLVPNADLLWQNVREKLRPRQQGSEAG
jgi:hypothetical protein